MREGHIERCQMDSGCSKPIILKEFTGWKSCTKFFKGNFFHYKTYGSNFISSSTASMGLWLMEFAKHSKQRVEYKFEVEKTFFYKNSCWDKIISNDILWNIVIYIRFSKKNNDWDGNRIPLMVDEIITNNILSALLNGIHTENQILKNADKFSSQIHNADSLKSWYRSNGKWIEHTSKY